MKQPKRRGSTLFEMVPRRFTAIGSSSSSPKSPHKMILPKIPLTSKDSIPLSGTSDSLAGPAMSASTSDASLEMPHKEDTLSPSLQKEEKRWSVSDLPSLKLHNQDFSALVGMLEQVRKLLLLLPDVYVIQ